MCVYILLDGDVDTNVATTSDNRNNTMLNGGVRSRMRLRHASASSNCSTGTNSTNGDVYTIGDVRNARNMPADNVIRQNIPIATASTSNVIPSASAAATSVTAITPIATANNSANWNDREPTWGQIMPPNQPVPSIPGQSALTDGRATGATSNSNNNVIISSSNSGGGSSGATPAPNLSDQQLQTQTSNDDEPLPAGWEIRYDPFGRRYKWFILHVLIYLCTT